MLTRKLWIHVVPNCPILHRSCCWLLSNPEIRLLLAEELVSLLNATLGPKRVAFFTQWMRVPTCTKKSQTWIQTTRWFHNVSRSGSPWDGLWPCRWKVHKKHFQWWTIKDITLHKFIKYSIISMMIRGYFSKRFLHKISLILFDLLLRGRYFQYSS